MKIKAKFIGPEKSLGYKPGKVYTLWMNENTVAGYEKCPIVIRRRFTGLCPYSSVRAFKKNWEIL